MYFNTGIDEHGQKVLQKSIELGYDNVQDYCDDLAIKWQDFCTILFIDYDGFYRTTSQSHKQNVLKYYDQIQSFVYSQLYTGKYCNGCEAFITEKDAVDNKCVVHKTELIELKELNKFFRLSDIKSSIEDILVDKRKSKELLNIINQDFDLCITRQNTVHGIQTKDNQVLYVWFEALLNYVFAIKYYEDQTYFEKYWNNSLIICGKDNLKFQGYFLQGLLLANNIPQTTEVLVHGNILDEQGAKLSKSLGNTIDVFEQVNKYGADPVRYYLAFCSSTTEDNKYSEVDLINKWNTEIVNNLGNLISRALHLIDIRGIQLDESRLSQRSRDSIALLNTEIQTAFNTYELHKVGVLLNTAVTQLNKTLSDSKPWEKNSLDYQEVLNNLYFELKNIIVFYQLVLKDHKSSLTAVFSSNKKAIVFNRL